MISDVRPGLFALATVLLACVSRASLSKPRSHGFFRFLAWEAIAALILINAPIWFHEWLSWHQVVSWLLLSASIIPLVLGVTALRSRGLPDSTKRPDGELLAFERTTSLVSDGVYRYIRHPLYTSLLGLTWGAFFKEPSAVGALLATCATMLLVVTAKRDESECVQVFGGDYAEYMRRTRMFIPYVL